jgi:hypothetical protein
MLFKHKDVSLATQNSFDIVHVLMKIYNIGLKQLEAKKTPIEKYMYLSNLRNNNVHLFYRLVQDNLTVCFLLS